MKVFVLGATGVVGRRAVSRLVAAGHAVTGVARTAEKEELLRRLGAIPVRVDIFDSGALHAAIQGHEAVVNLATHIPPVSKTMAAKNWATNDRIRREVSKNAVDAALAHGATAYVQESITFPYVDSGAEWISEDRERDFAPVMRSSADAEAQAARFGSDGRRGVVLRFSMFIAPDADHTRSFQSLLRWRIAPIFGAPEAFASCIHADDAATAVAAALRVPSGIYNVSEDRPLRRRELVDTMAARQGSGRPLMLPSWLAAANGALVRVLMRSQRVSSAKFKGVSDWSPRHASAVEGLSVSTEGGARSAGTVSAR